MRASKAFLGLALAGLCARSLAATCVVEDAEAPTAMTMQGLWHVADGASDTCVGYRSGTHAFYFGVDSLCSYDDKITKDASLVTPPLALSSPSDAILSFWTKWQVESVNPSCYDQLWLEREEPGGWVKMAEIGPVSDPPGGSPLVGMASVTGLGGVPGWQFYVFDLSAYVPSTHRFRFRFRSGAFPDEGSCFFPPDAVYDQFLGWVIDDLGLGCLASPLTIQKSANPSFAAPGGAITFTLAVKNWDTGTQTLQVWDTLPPDINFVSASGGGSLGPGNVVNWSLPSMPGRATQVLTLALQVDPGASAPQDFSNTGSGSSSAGGSAFQSPAALVKIRNSGLVLKKSSSQSTVTSGDRVTFTMEISNFTSSAIAQVDLSEYYPQGFVEAGVSPGYSFFRGWRLLGLQPGETRYFAVWGFQNGLNDQIVTNKVEARVSGSLMASDSVDILIHRPEAPQMSIRAVYPQPAPSGKAGLPQSAFIYFETNQAIDLQMQVFSTAGDLVRRVNFHAERGKNQVEWDLKNDFGLDSASGIYVARLWGRKETGGVEAWAHIAVLR